MRYEPIAIVGVGVHFPKADSPPALWKILCEGIDTASEIPPGRWELASLYDPAPDRPGKIRNRRAALIEGVDMADPSAFRLPKRELRQMDPQHRVLFESAWHALEDAGIPFDALRGSNTGVFVGINFGDFQRMLARDWSALDGYALLGTTASFAANRISYAFDLRGPSTCSSVGCASSTAALHEACRSLALGEVDLAIAGGVELMLSPESSILLSQGGVLSARGQCRTLDAEADGYVRGEGAGMVVLKPLSRVDASDRVYAVIRGSAVNHNGRNEWIMAPSASAQADVIRRACAQGGVEPASLDYVELHGSSFLKGDAAEAVAIGEALGKQRSSPCRLGAVSNNLGYMGAAAGIAQLIKVCLSLYHRTLPPTIHVDSPNPQIAFEELGLRVQSKLERWPERAAGVPGRAGIVSTSLGGANAFVVLEAAPEARPAKPSGAEAAGHLLVLSALTPEALRQHALQLRDFLAGTAASEVSLEDVCFTAAFRRQHHRHRAAVIAGGREGLMELLGVLARSSEQALLVEEGQPAGLAEAGRAYVDGGALSREAFSGRGGRCVSLPVYPFQRQRLWPEWLSPEEISRPPSESRPRIPASSGSEAVAANEILGAPTGERVARLKELLRRQVADVLEVEPAALDMQGRTFFELGLTSLGVTLLKERISRELDLALTATIFFEHPRLEPLAKQLAILLDSRTGSSPKAERPAGAPAVAATPGADDAIAIIGMGCRFPGGAAGPARYRELLWSGGEAVTELPADRRALQGLYDPEPSKPGKMYLRRAAFVEGVDRFDAEFFRISRREAEGMDPQQRFFLEVSWEALEDAGIPPQRLAGTRTGVFAGVHAKDYAFAAEGGLEKVGAHYSTGVDASYVAGRLSYLLGLEGPSMAVDTACSSSLSAVHLACQSLRTGESALAIAGGVKLILSPQLSVFLSKAGALSPSNRCRAFDRAADGMVQGEGCGVVILKRYRDAVRDGDRILATIRGTAMNHDGASGGLTVPNVRAQEALYRLALDRAGVEPGQVDYLEAHGTGTRLGDPIELEGVSRVYGGARRQERPLWIGSVKPNIGHTEAAAGIAGLIKAVLVLQAGELPPSINFEHPNPEFAWDGSGLAVPRERTPLASKAGPHLAAVSSFGMSGVNAHALIEAHREPASARPDAGPYLLPISARSDAALRELAGAWLRLLTAGSVASLQDCCFTAGAGRAHHEHRLALVARTPEELRSLLQAAADGRAGEGIFRGQVKATGGREAAIVFRDDVPRVGSAGGDAWHGALSRAARLYCAGFPIRFERLYPGARKAALPTYPWQRERFWWDGEREPAKVAPVVEDGTAENAEALQGLYCELTWNAREAGREQAQADGTWLVVAEEPEVAGELRDGLAAAGGSVVVASAGSSYEKVSARSYRLDFASRESFSRLLGELASAGQELRGVIFRARTGHPESLDGPRGVVRREAVAVTSIVQALAGMGAPKPPRLYLVTRGAQSIGGETGPVSLVGAPLWGLGRVIAYEHPELACKRIDADPAAGPEPLRALVSELGRRLAPTVDDDEIVLRGDRRLAPSLSQGRKTPGRAGAFRPKRDRTYLITGGLGGIGLRLASWLVARGARHLAVCGRSGETPEARKALEPLRAAGARVETFRVDVSRPEAVADMLDVLRRGGTPLGGIFHCAGVLADGSLLQLEPRSFEAVMGPKVDGAWNLHTLATDASIEQFVLFSSTASLIGSPGQANYAAANAFLDALAHHRRARGLPALSLNYGNWAEVGMAAADDRRGARLAERGMTAMPVDDALAAMALTLADGAVTRGIAHFDAERWVHSHPSIAASSLFRRPSPQEEGSVVDPAPRKLREVLLSMEGSARRGVLEARLKQMVGEVSKVSPERLSSTDSFDALGFDSIMALELRDMVMGELEVNLPLKSFVDERSIGQVTAELLEKLAVASVLGAASSERKDTKRVLL